jgi:hypothetical protein
MTFTELQALRFLSAKSFRYVSGDSIQTRLRLDGYAMFIGTRVHITDAGRERLRQLEEQELPNDCDRSRGNSGGTWPEFAREDAE